MKFRIGVYIVREARVSWTSTRCQSHFKYCGKRIYTRTFHIYTRTFHIPLKSLVKIGAVKVIIGWRSTMKLCPHQQHVSSDLDKIIKKMSKKICLVMASIYRIGAVTNMLYLRASMPMYLYIAHLSPALGVVRFYSSTRNAIEHLQLTWKSAQEKAVIFLWV